MAHYEDQLPMRAARQRYFDDNGLRASGYEDRWVVLRVRRVPVLAFPNTAARVRAVKLHDLHHVVTGYETSWTGEAAIGAWEIGAGCHHHLAAWYLNVSVLGIGLFIAPRATWRAFLRGRQSRTLYAGEFDEALLDTTVGALRAQLALDQPVRPGTWGDRLAFTGWSFLSCTQFFGPSIAFSVWLLSR